MIGWMFKNRWFALIWVALVVWRVVAFTSVASSAKDALDGVNQTAESTSDEPKEGGGTAWDAADERARKSEQQEASEEDDQRRAERDQREERDYERAAAKAQRMSDGQGY
jgi:hypothetical protein